MSDKDLKAAVIKYLKKSIAPSPEHWGPSTEPWALSTEPWVLSTEPQALSTAPLCRPWPWPGSSGSYNRSMSSRRSFRTSESGGSSHKVTRLVGGTPGWVLSSGQASLAPQTMWLGSVFLGLCFNTSAWDVQFSSVQSLSCVWLFVTPWTTAC